MALGIFDIKTIIESVDPSLSNVVGIGLVSLIVFAESGLLVGFFLPGDSMLISVGILASKGLINIYFLLFFVFLSAVIGDNVGYSTGRRFGKRLFTRKESKFFKPEHLIKEQEFYEKHGGKTIILARFIPFVRTFAPVVAGIGDMNYKTFFLYNLTGGFLWAVGVTLLGFFLGKIPGIDNYLLVIIGIIIFVSVAPAVWHIFKEPENRQTLRRTAASSYSKVRRRKNV